MPHLEGSPSGYLFRGDPHVRARGMPNRFLSIRRAKNHANRAYRLGFRPLEQRRPNDGNDESESSLQKTVAELRDLNRKITLAWPGTALAVVVLLVG